MKRGHVLAIGVALIVVGVALVAFVNNRNAQQRIDRARDEAAAEFEITYLCTLTDAQRSTRPMEYRRKFELASDVLKSAQAEWRARYDRLDHEAKMRASKDFSARIKLATDGISDPLDKIAAAEKAVRRMIAELR